MFQIISVLFLSLITSPHHHRHMGPGMGPGMASGIGKGKIVSNETEIYLDTNISNNNTDIESDIETDEGEQTDFGVSIGIGSSFGIVVFIISFLSLKGKKQNAENIYIEPIENNESSSDHEVITNPNYEDIYNYDNDDDPEIINIENKKMVIQ